MKYKNWLVKLAESLVDKEAMEGDVSDLNLVEDLGNGDVVVSELGMQKTAAEFKGQKVTLNKPRYLKQGEPGHGRKKYVVYVKKGDRVKRITFGDPNLSSKPSNPDARRSFKARHKCDTKKDKTTPGYWACRWPPNW